MPKDLVPVFRDGIVEWEKLGGMIRLTPDGVSLNAVLNGKSRRVLPCQRAKVRPVSEKMIESWGGRSEEIFPVYLEALGSSARVQEAARSSKWIEFARLGPEDLRLLLGAARRVVVEFRSAD